LATHDPVRLPQEVEAACRAVIDRSERKRVATR
jgi:hypothetical protein